MAACQRACIAPARSLAPRSSGLDWDLPDPTPRTTDALAALDHLVAPVWVFDLDAGVKWWANRSGLALWNAASNAEMRARNPVAQMSEATRIRLDALRRRLARGEVSRERWNFYPTDAPTFAAELSLSGIVIADAPGGPPRLAMLVEARPLRDDELDPFVRRGAEVLRYLGEMVSLYDPAGHLLMRNPSAVAAFGDLADLPRDSDAFTATLLDPAAGRAIRERVAAGPVHLDLEVRTLRGLAWHALDARESLDPVSGRTCLLVNQRDISARVAAERVLEDSHRQLAAAAAELRRLSASPLRVWPGVLAIPFIGKIDDPRLHAALAGLQRRLAAEAAQVVLLDLTAAEELSAAAFRRVIQALRLQGVAVRVAGVPPALALSLVGAVGDTPIHASLADALAAHLGA